MKKILKPATEEESVTYSDFTGKLLLGTPEVELDFWFNYGSPFDGSGLHLHLTSEEAAPILELIKSKLSKDKKQELTTLSYNQSLASYFNE